MATTDINNLTITDFKIEKMKAEQRIIKILKEFTNNTKMNVDDLNFNKMVAIGGSVDYIIELEILL